MNRIIRKLSLIISTVFLFSLFTLSFVNCSGPLRNLFPSENKSFNYLGTDTGNPLTYKGIAQLPNIFLISDFPQLPSNHQILTVGKDKQFQDCQAALDASLPGDEVVIDSGYICDPIILKDKGNSGQFIVIRTSAWQGLPMQGKRVSSADAASMAIVETSVDGYAVYAEEKANHYYLAGLEIRVNENFNGVLRGLVSVGPWYLTPTDQLPNNIIFSRVWMHGSPLQEILNGIIMNGSSISVVDSLLENIHSHSEPGTAISGWKMGSGPFKIVNNEIISSVALSLGGYATSEDQIPSDVEFRKNYVHQLVEWRQPVTSLAGLTGPWRAGSLMSLNNAQRVLVSGNIFENEWSQLENSIYGYAIDFSPDALSNGTPGTGQPWVRVQDITFINNIVRNAAGAFSIVYQNFDDNRAIAQRLEISNNLVYNIGTSWGDSLGVILLRQYAQGPVVFNHNTLLNVEGAGPQLLNPWSRGLYSYFTFTNNLCADQGDGIKDSNNASGSATLLAMFPSVIFGKNVLAGQLQSSYDGFSSSNYFPANIESIGFMSVSSNDSSDYHSFGLSKQSAYSKQALDGTDIGVDMSVIDQAMK
ncbi:MAG: hypothetical protein ACXVCR_11630 [Bdellovibrio sp.]